MRHLVFILLLSFLVTACTMKPAEQGFKDISDKIVENPSERRYGVAVRYHDGRPEAFVTGFGAPNQLLRWQDGMLTDVTPEPLRDPESDAIGAAWCDIDDDGVEELYVLTTDTYGGRKRFTDHLYDKTDQGWTDRFNESEVPNRYAGRSVACHYSPDGYGFFVARYGGPMQLITDVNGELRDVAPKYDMDRTTGGRSIVNVPTQDGVDLFLGNERGPNYYYDRKNNSYEEKADELGVSAPTQNARGTTVLDVNQDGNLDIAVANWEDYHRIYNRTQDGFQDIAPTSFNKPTPARSLIAHDFDGDGSVELFLNNIGTNNSYHAATGEELPIGSAEEPQGFGTGAAVADFNQDGVPELLIAHGESRAQEMTLYRHTDAEPQTTVIPRWEDGSPARNARVTFKDSGGVSAVDGGSAYLNQMGPTVSRGTNVPVEVQVRYADGTIVNKTVTQRQTVIRPDQG